MGLKASYSVPWRSGDSPDAQLLSCNADRLSDAEILTALLRTGSALGTAGESTEVADLLLGEFKTLAGILAAPVDRLLAVPGIGRAKVASLLASREMLRRAEFCEVRDRQADLDGSGRVKRYLCLEIGSETREVFGVLSLDNRHRLLASDKLFFGSIDRAAVYPRGVVLCCLKHNASAAILFHNHPSGVPEPSASDESITNRIKEILGEVDIRLLDHVVVGCGADGLGAVSFAERGLL